MIKRWEYFDITDAVHAKDGFKELEEAEEEAEKIKQAIVNDLRVRIIREDDYGVVFSNASYTLCMCVVKEIFDPDKNNGEDILNRYYVFVSVKFIGSGYTRPIWNLLYNYFKKNAHIETDLVWTWGLGAG